MVLGSANYIENKMAANVAAHTHKTGNKQQQNKNTLNNYLDYLCITLYG